VVLGVRFEVHFEAENRPKIDLNYLVV